MLAQLKKSDDNTLVRYRSPTLNHTYAFAGEYYLMAALWRRAQRDIERFSVTKVTVIDEAHLCRPRLQVDGLGPCGRPVAVSAPASLRARSLVSEHCSRPLEARTDVQFVVLYAGGQGRPPLVQCSGSTGPPESCGKRACTYNVIVGKRCLRQGETAKVVLRQMWRGKTDVLLEALAVGYLTATDRVVHASIDGAPLAFLSDVETLVLNGSGSQHLEGGPLAYSWSCDNCDKNGSLYQAFIKKHLDQQVVEIADELQYGLTKKYNFVLRVWSGSHSDEATIGVRVPGDQDDQMALSCPCCEFGVVSGEDLVLEARPQRTKVWGTRYPVVTWRISGPSASAAPVRLLSEQRGAVLLLPAGNVSKPGAYRITASAWNQRPYADVHYVLTHELFERQGLREQSDFPPVKGRCQVTPEEGVAVKTIFRIGCTGFRDPEGGALSYGFYICSHTPDMLKDLEGGRPKPWHSCTHLKSSLDDGTFTGVLPPGTEANCSVLVFVNDNVGQYAYDLITVIIQVGPCSDITLDTVDDYAIRSQQNSSDAVLSYIRSSSMLLNSKFHKQCNTSGDTISRAADVLDDYVGYLKNSTVTTESELHNAVSVLQVLVPATMTATTDKLTNSVIELIGSYANTFSELTSTESNWRIADLTATIGEELIDGLTALLDLKAPTPLEQPEQVPNNFYTDSDCLTVEKLVHNMARVAAGVARVVDTDENDAYINVREYQVWIRESQRQGFLGTSDGTRVRTEGNTDAQTAIVFPSNPFRCHETAKLTNTQAVGTEAARRIVESFSVSVPTESYLKRPTPLSFDGGTYKTSCLFWNSTEHAYSSSGCRVLMDSDEQFVHCSCEHSSIFAGGLFIAPHPIDFTDLGFLLLAMSNNVVMSVIISTVWVVYLLVMVWAWREDTRDEAAAGIEYLAENQQDDTFGYLVSVYTWFLKGSGTTSRVLLVVQGSEDRSRQVVLRDGARNPLALQAGGRDWYFLSHPSSLGNIEAIVLTVELKGYEGPWHLSTVVVRDLQTASRAVFIVDQVLAPDAHAGASVFTFQVADESLLRNPWRIFYARIIRYFREEHLIFSIFSRLPTSNFTRKQRASVALLLVTQGMMVSLMFYGLDADEEESFSWLFLYTLLEWPAWREVIIALQSTLLVTPFAFLVVFLFEKSRPSTYRRKPTVPKVYVEDVVQDWVQDTDTSGDTSKTGSVPRERLTSNAQLPLFPGWVSVVAWILCLSASLVASALVVLYGLTYGYRRSLSWVRCNLINVLLSEFVISPLKILCFSAVMACVLKAPVEMESIPVRFIE
ncbi:hypothetical protein HPB50_023671 [Hyalomma asiaticum]|uniref:Uncharacterized protein n=1 Tax=Hyalomma asiaticum TaxID=266040 RepID=A0ACB7T4S5_HYAAI|nr:hypothetical protein HPB50_023671 [Hyalomma asiaticum]